MFSQQGATEQDQPKSDSTNVSVPSLEDVPAYSGEPFVIIDGGNPSFSQEELNCPDGTEVYGNLDSLGRATFAFAKVCRTTMPPAGKDRDNNMPDPTGFKQASYPSLALDHLYERTHLIARSFNDEDTTLEDLITGTHFLNHDTMGSFENQIRVYLNADRNGYAHTSHVLMRVTPDFKGSDLVARGVHIEALSLEDEGRAVKLNIYCYNVQPGITIDYATGTSRLTPLLEAEETETPEIAQPYVLNTNTKVFHMSDCPSVVATKLENRKEETVIRSDLMDCGYKPCGSCKP